MNKNELVQYVKESAGLSTAESLRAVSALIEGISSSLEKGEGVTFVGFGSFTTINRKSRTGRNPRTGDPIISLHPNRSNFVQGNLSRSVLPDATREKWRGILPATGSFLSFLLSPPSLHRKQSA